MPTEKAGSGIPQGAACAFASRMCAGSRSRLDVGEARKKEGVVVGFRQVVKARVSMISQLLLPLVERP